jgi:hypothetical protein
MTRLSDEITEKSIAAALAAIEIYNKPDFRYREETFAILMTNAWELLLKAKFIRDNGDNANAIVEMEKVTDANGNVTKKPKLNRSGNEVTFGLTYLLEKLYQQAGSNLSQPCYENIHLLVEVRDNAIHFINKDLYFSRRIQEIGTASLRHYLTRVEAWFSKDLSCYNFFLMPISFYHGFEAIEPVSISAYTEQMKNFLRYLASVEDRCSSEEECNVTIRMETRIMRSKDPNAVGIRWTDDPNAPVMQVREEDMLQGYPYEYRTLTDALKQRYVDFIENNDYHAIRKPLEKLPQFCKVRYLDPKKVNSSKKRYYSSEVFKEFDKHYTKWGTNAAR